MATRRDGRLVRPIPPPNRPSKRPVGSPVMQPQSAGAKARSNPAYARYLQLMRRRFQLEAARKRQMERLRVLREQSKHKQADALADKIRKREAAIARRQEQMDKLRDNNAEDGGPRWGAMAKQDIAKEQSLMAEAQRRREVAAAFGNDQGYLGIDAYAAGTQPPGYATYGETDAMTAQAFIKKHRDSMGTDWTDPAEVKLIVERRKPNGQMVKEVVTPSVEQLRALFNDPVKEMRRQGMSNDEIAQAGQYDYVPAGNGRRVVGVWGINAPFRTGRDERQGAITATGNVRTGPRGTRYEQVVTGTERGQYQSARDMQMGWARLAREDPESFAQLQSAFYEAGYYEKDPLGESGLDDPAMYSPGTMDRQTHYAMNLSLIHI